MNIKFLGGETEEDTQDLTLVITSCPACFKESAGEVCMHCGEELYPRRLTLLQLVKDIPDVFFDVDSGLFYTMRTFFTSPGKQIKGYFTGDRKRHYKPLKYILFIGGFTTFIYAKYPITNGRPESALDAFGTQWTTLILLLQMPLIAFFTWLIFMKRRNTYGEHLVANSYIIAQVSLFYIATFPFKYFLNGTGYVALFDGLYLLFILGYYSFVFYDWFYDRKNSRGLLLSISVTFLIFILTIIFTIIMTSYLYILFRRLGWT